MATGASETPISIVSPSPMTKIISSAFGDIDPYSLR